MENSELKERKIRSDKGKLRTPYLIGGRVCRMDLRGRLLDVYGGIAEAVKCWNADCRCVRPVSYSGVWSCVQGRRLATGGFMWRSEAGVGMGYVDASEIDAFVGEEVCDE